MASTKYRIYTGVFTLGAITAGELVGTGSLFLSNVFYLFHLQKILHMNSLANDPHLVTLRNKREQLIDVIQGFAMLIPGEYLLQLREVDEQIAAVSKRLTAGATIIETHTDFSPNTDTQ